MKLNFLPFLSAAVLAAALPNGVCADVTPSTAPTGSTADADAGQHHKRDINKWLDKHPRIKAKILAKFDTNHDGRIDGDEVKAVREWIKERRERRLAEGKGNHHGDKGDQNAAASPTPAPVPAQ